MGALQIPTWVFVSTFQKLIVQVEPGSAFFFVIMRFEAFEVSVSDLRGCAVLKIDVGIVLVLVCVCLLRLGLLSLGNSIVDSGLWHL